MTKLRLGPIEDDKPVRLTVELPAAVHRDLLEYGRLLARESGQAEIAPAKLIPPMLVHFMEGDRGFRKLRGER
ncbi:DUF2274 domain-containing protein [Acidomonas methanolica]|uniref:DUF2274 domain-containing protein n=1 Tax=Acidomonas methanolica NBRC 104435 TaxID=1231351 RepID=A0A023D0Z8_ACIMT|nr:DUF2274 domain-containing protein [Acidomonas methanolica]MBU2655505.1 DUF2274 domain-containing protein [Acidomonas methanolica]TCS19781.1 hypothetical protein EDC31_14813 [Acidomonas methanolica]GAJ27828.1 hypothetical protein Amme_007_002 [Acidomonas methanolica NBRC 104435]GBQ50593.1 hypothetical protein AA0498_1253 [Acidomonas methanolica]GEL00613.1 hypothetical protein AME01nite_31110 [Acidomonas methanolica NBRC 104435]